MKKIVLNISDSTYEKLRFESILEKKGINEIIQNRIFDKPFSQEIEDTFTNWMEKKYQKLLKE